MNPSDTVLDVVDLFRRREEIIVCLAEEPRDKRTLVEELDIPRSTLDRAIRELEAVNVVNYKEGKYRVTPVGRRIARNFFSFLERAELIMELEPFLQWTPKHEFDLDLRYLEDAELLLSKSNDPYAMVNHHVEALKNASSFRGILPLIGFHAFETAYEQVMENGANHEVIVTPGVVETMETEECYASLYRPLLGHDGFSISVYDGSIPYFLGVFDDETVQIGIDENEKPRALIETDHPEVQSWANDTISHYKQQAKAPAEPGRRETSIREYY